jgi:hypothetical protein
LKKRKFQADRRLLTFGRGIWGEVVISVGGIKIFKKVLTKIPKFGVFVVVSKCSAPAFLINPKTKMFDGKSKSWRLINPRFVVP